MANFRVIWKHEVDQANQIAKILLKDQKVGISWKLLVPPLYLYNLYEFKKAQGLACKNFLFTKKLAFNAAKNILQGKERSWEIRHIEIKTREILDKEKKGLYTEDIRSKQFNEIELLIDYYLDLMNTNQSRYTEILKAIYPSRGNYLSFLTKLRKLEEEVIQAAITTMRKGTKKGRREWFDKVRTATKKVRLKKIDKIYSGVEKKEKHNALR
jgi:hypothetical protein